MHAVENGEPLALENLKYEDVDGDIEPRRVFSLRAHRAGEDIAIVWRDETDREGRHL